MPSFEGHAGEMNQHLSWFAAEQLLWEPKSHACQILVCLEHAGGVDLGWPVSRSW